MEGSVDDLVNLLFKRNAPYGRGEVRIDPMDMGIRRVSELFEFLLTFFTKAMRSRFGNSIDLSTISHDEIQNFKSYFEGVGYTFNVMHFHPYQVLKMELDESYHFGVDVGEYDRELYPFKPKPKYFKSYKTHSATAPIEDHYFQLKSKTSGDYYVINFEFIPLE